MGLLACCLLVCSFNAALYVLVRCSGVFRCSVVVCFVTSEAHPRTKNVFFTAHETEKNRRLNETFMGGAADFARSR